jgi:hypothetical protein
MLRKARTAAAAATLAAAALLPITAAHSAIAAGTSPAQSTCDGDAAFPVSNGEYTVQANEWNSTATQCISSDGNADFSVDTANFGLTTSGAPATYPSIYKGCHWGACSTGSGLPIQVSKLASATSSWDTTQVGSGAYDVAYDLWINSTPTTTGQPDGTEIMIWLNSRGGVQPFGGKTGTSTAAGHNWDVWTGQQTSWKIISYVLQGGGTSFTNLDVKALIDDATQRGSVNANHYLIDAEAGFEIWQGGQGLATKSFSFNATSTDGSSGGTTTGGTTGGSTTGGSTTGGTTTGGTTTGGTTTGGTTTGGTTTGGTTTGGTTTGGTTTGGTTTGGTTTGGTTTGGTTTGGSTTGGSTTGGSTGGNGSGPSCKAVYTTSSDWGSGFNANVTVTNTGSTALKSWTVGWSFPGAQKITNAWNASYTQSGAAVTASNMSYNGSVAAGGNTSFGFQGAPGGAGTPTLTCTAS